jgi:pyridoxamine 5'-phosphate oxidase
MILEIPRGSDPIELFKEWFNKAEGSGIYDPTEMALATATKDGQCSVRVVLLKEMDGAGFCFFTNYNSPKSRVLEENPSAALAFHWQEPCHRQVRIQGVAEKLTFEENNAYFQTRPRGSQIGAYASPQSEAISDRGVLEKAIADLNVKYADGEIPCPEFWGGWRIKPLRIEFWQAQEYRLHDRFAFTRADFASPWQMERLAP